MIKPIGAKFLTSAFNLNQSEFYGVSEVAFLGRSNVGKSSFINALTNQKNLAKSSATPGKTKLINFFEAKFKDDLEKNYNLILVDLPGFGYAKVAKNTHQIWQNTLDEFIKKRNTIRLFIHLRDSRQFNTDIDENVDLYIKSFIRNDQKLINFYTKSDKLNQSDKAKVLKFDQNAKFISVLKNQGINEARELIIKGVFGGV